MCILPTPTISPSCVVQNRIVVKFHILMNLKELLLLQLGLFDLQYLEMEAVKNYCGEYFCAIFLSCMDVYAGFIYYNFMAVCIFHSVVHLLSLQCHSVYRK
jgi:hypothetical protein